MNWEKYLRSEEVANVGDGTPDGLESNGDTYRIKQIEHLIMDIFVGKKMLDIGANNHIDKQLRKLGFRVTGLSLIPQPGTMLGDMHEIPFKDKEFKSILCSHTLEHSISPYIALCEMNRVLKLGGHVILIFPEEGDFWTYAPHHYSCLTVNQIWSLLLKTGFEVMRTTRFKFRINQMEVKQDIGVLAKKVREWKHPLGPFKTHLIPFNTGEINFTPMISVQDILYLKNDDEVKSTYV